MQNTILSKTLYNCKVFEAQNIINGKMFDINNKNDFQINIVNSAYCY